MIIFIAIAIVLIWLIFLVILAFTKIKQDHSADASQPLVSILISLRNEETNAESLCNSLSQLLYPKSKFEILFGDDDSDDKTLAILQQHKPENAKVIHFGNDQTGSFGKQKVLVALSKQAKGDYFLFTDADMTFQAAWIQGMLKQSNEDRIVVGFTKVSGNNWFAALQNLDWLFNEWIIGVFSKLGFNLTAWGNNMLISKKTYEKIGGYESLNQTVVEDVALLRKLTLVGGKLAVNVNPTAVATTKPMSSWSGLLHQRKRWMAGLSGYWPLFIMAGLVKLLFWPATIILVIVNQLWISVFFVCLVLKWVVFVKIFKVTKSKFSIIQLLLFEIYDFVFYLFTFAFHLLPIRVDWKGRRY